LGAAKQKSHQKVMMFDFDAEHFNQNSISSKNGDYHSICREILHRSLMLTFHLEPIIKSILLIEQTGIKSSLFDVFVTPPSTVEKVLNKKISKKATNP
jgi:hypothetical protein